MMLYQHKTMDPLVQVFAANIVVHRKHLHIPALEKNSDLIIIMRGPYSTRYQLYGIVERFVVVQQVNIFGPIYSQPTHSLQLNRTLVNMRTVVVTTNTWVDTVVHEY